MSKFKDKDPVESALVDLISVVVSLLLRGLEGFICSFGAKEQGGWLWLVLEFLVPRPAQLRATCLLLPLGGAR